jgi:hypothetical protein
VKNFADGTRIATAIIATPKKLLTFGDFLLPREKV